MAEKFTILVLKVDLQCPGCYKKIKKVLCKFPQVRDQIYDEKKNTVTIRVCCSPEKIRDKISYKGGKSIQGIEIITPSKPKDADKPKGTEKPKDLNKPKEAEKPKAPEKTKDSAKSKEADKPKGNEKGEKPAAENPKEAAKADPPKHQIVEVQPMPVAGVPTAAAYTYYGPCYEGNSTGGAYYHGYGRPITQCGPQYHQNYGYGYGYDRNAVVNRYDYFSEENPSACSIM